MPRSSENWDAYQYTPGQSARRQFIVTGVTTTTGALAACPVKAGSTHPNDRRLVAGIPSASTPQDPQTFVIDVSYDPLSLSNGDDSGSVDNLKLPPTYSIQLGSNGEPVDLDIYKNPIVNSAGDAFSSSVNKQITTVFYVYKRWEPQYNGILALAYGNVVNSDRIELPGFGFIDPGQGLLAPPKLISGDITRDTKSVQVQYAMELREEGFTTRILDKGQRAFYSASKPPGPIFNDQGQQITNDVRLNGKGAPLDSGYKVNDATTNPINKPNLPDKVKLEKPSGNLAVYLHYVLYDSKPFAALGLVP